MPTLPKRRLKLVHAAPSSPDCATGRGGKKSSAVTAPPVTSRIFAAMSRPGHDGSPEQSNVTYAGDTPIARAKSPRFMPADSNHAPSLLIVPDYSAALNFSQDEKFSRALWNRPAVIGTLPPMAKNVTSRLKRDTVNHFIKQWRAHRRLTQEQLAERVDMSTSSISQLETGKQDYTQSTLEALAYALSCKPGDLLMRDPTREDAPWSILDSLKPATKRQALAILKAMADADKADRAA